MTSFSRDCPDCGKLIEYKCYKSWHSATSRNSVCKSCRSVRANKSDKRNASKENNPAWKGYEGMPYKWFSKYFERPRNRKPAKPGDITIEQMHGLYVKQGGKCALSGVALHWGELPGGTYDVSIDRVDSAVGYFLHNVQLVHKDVNLMKNHFDQAHFIEFCKKIADNN